MIQDYFWQNLFSFLFLSFVVAFTSTAMREESWKEILRKGTKYFFFMVGGITLFCGFISLLEKYFH